VAPSIAGTGLAIDANGNSTDPGEVSGVELTLSCTLNGAPTKRSTLTNAGGSDSFADLGLGFDCTASVVPSPVLADKEPTEVCGPHTDIRTNITGCDFGYALPPVAGDTVFFDLNGDGAQQAGEPGLVGVKVVIEAPASGGFPGYSDNMTTDVNGKYLFHVPGVPGGSTLVAHVTCDAGTGDARGKDITTPNPQDTIPLGPGGVDLARDFGFKPRSGDAQVGDTVFSDDDGDGRQQAGEHGLAGVQVSITCPASGGSAASPRRWRPMRRASTSHRARHSGRQVGHLLGVDRHRDRWRQGEGT
jgi:hypothetical protein